MRYTGEHSDRERPMQDEIRLKLLEAEIEQVTLTLAALNARRRSLKKAISEAAKAKKDVADGKAIQARVRERKDLSSEIWGDRLSAFEMKIYGASYTGIANEMNISAATAKSYVRKSALILSERINHHHPLHKKAKAWLASA
jgi:DNA invertase Pin-like site-specific DNA recombinase